MPLKSRANPCSFLSRLGVHGKQSCILTCARAPLQWPWCDGAQVGLLLLGAPWLSSASALRAPDGRPDAAATADAYVARMRAVLSPAAKSSAHDAKGSRHRRRQIWRRIMLHVFGAGLGAALGRLSRRLCWQPDRPRVVM